MKVLVTGHKGYIGSVLVPMLLERGHEVSGLDSDLFADCTYTGELARIPEHLGDVRDVPIDVVAGKDAVIHLAGLSNDPLGDYDVVFAMDVLEFIHGRRGVEHTIAKLVAAVRPGGLLVISMCRSPPEVDQAWWQRWVPEGADRVIPMIAVNPRWAERYDRDLKDIFALQDDVTLKVLTAIRV